MAFPRPDSPPRFQWQTPNCQGSAADESESFAFSKSSPSSAPSGPSAMGTATSWAVELPRAVAPLILREPRSSCTVSVPRLLLVPPAAGRGADGLMWRNTHNEKNILTKITMSNPISDSASNNPAVVNRGSQSINTVSKLHSNCPQQTPPTLPTRTRSRTRRVRNVSIVAFEDVSLGNRLHR